MTIPKSLLIVDDDENSLELLSRRLEAEGYMVEVAKGGDEALEILRGEQFDLILLDVKMPVVSGHDVLLRIKGDATTLDIPVIMVSGVNDRDTIIKCLTLGASDFIIKPYNMKIVKSRIWRCLGTWRGAGIDRSWQEEMKGSKILIVDDDEYNRDLLERRVKQNGYVATCVNNGKEAISILEDNPFDLMLLDLMMPEIDGLGVLKHLKDQDMLQNMPVIIVTAINDTQSMNDCIEQGAADYITKPFNPVLLKTRIESCLKEKKLRDADQEQ